MAKIRIRNMMFYGFHGIYEYEREQGQKFFVDVEMTTKDEHAAETDRPEDGVDAAAVYSLVKTVIEEHRCYLLQALATHINKRILGSHPQLGAVRTTIRKPSVPISGPLDYVEVEVENLAE